MSLDRSRLLAVVALATLVAGCGPTSRTELSIRQDSLNVAYGGQSPTPGPTTPIGPGTPLGPLPGAGTPGSLPHLPPPPLTLPPIGPPPTIPPVVCPSGGPGLVTSLAPAQVQNPMVAATYTFGRNGEVDNDNNVRSLKASAITHTISGVTAKTDDKGLVQGDYTDTVFEGNRAVATSYRLVQQPADDKANGNTRPAGGTGGLFITRIATSTSAGRTDFTPDQPVRIVTLPFAAESGPVTETGVDSAHRTRVQIQHRVTGQTVVSICGKGYQVWDAEVVAEFSDDTTAPAVRHEISLFLASQFGGLPLRVVDSFVDYPKHYALTSDDTLLSVPGFLDHR